MTDQGDPPRKLSRQERRHAQREAAKGAYLYTGQSGWHALRSTRRSQSTPWQYMSNGQSASLWQSSALFVHCSGMVFR